MKQSVTTSSDSQLVALIRQSDQSAEAALYGKYSARIYFLALGELHSREDAEDVCAETFLRVIQALRLDKLRNPEALSSFVVGTALNIVREYTRESSRSQSLTEQEFELADERSFEAAFLDEDVVRSMKEAAQSLKPRERDFLRMYYYEELPKEEIARLLGIKEERLRLIKSRALKRFGEVYKKLTGK
jgi:RNA polymerase sigma-70 factor (ECF subfamily)